MPKETFECRNSNKFKISTKGGKHLWREHAELVAENEPGNPIRSTMTISITSNDPEPVFAEGDEYTMEIKDAGKKKAAPPETP